METGGYIWLVLGVFNKVTGEMKMTFGPWSLE
jgi:hypothetical protein